MVWKDKLISAIMYYFAVLSEVSHSGVGVTKPIFPFRYFPNFSEWWKQWLPEWYQVCIWQVSLQMSCRDTWQIWTWLKVSNLYFCKIKISSNREINKRSFSNPHPWSESIVLWTVVFIPMGYITCYHIYCFAKPLSITRYGFTLVLR